MPLTNKYVENPSIRRGLARQLLRSRKVYWTFCNFISPADTAFCYDIYRLKVSTARFTAEEIQESFQVPAQ